MSEEFHLVLRNEDDARRAEELLKAITIGGRPGMRVRRTGTDIMTGCGIFEKLDGDPELLAPGRPAKRFSELFYQAGGMKSGMHHPDGILWIRRDDRRHVGAAERIHLTKVAPTLLAMQGVAPPPQMRGGVIEEVLGPRAPAVATAGV